MRITLGTMATVKTEWLGEEPGPDAARWPDPLASDDLDEFQPLGLEWFEGAE